MPTERVFRKPESFEAERLSRDAVRPFLESRGFTVLSDERIVRGVSQAQVVTARSEPGETIKMRVRLCWRHRGSDDYVIRLPSCERTSLTMTGIKRSTSSSIVM
ncbi:hypothetical protein [Burkholderia multivorans]|uniref:hypothetical protein n=1 Tax=Burkholderia multivorans TaxID=87883 RepID=UPI00350FF543|nr:hypothetical protein [Burkholderia multivorans]MCA8178288.1 hypothetical protein [Burkholderia multivorans]